VIQITLLSRVNYYAPASVYQHTKFKIYIHCTTVKLFDTENIITFKSGFGVTQVIGIGTTWFPVSIR